jgi:phosphoribosylformimino-5-aminoimidazole carboxamide ribonucleotide (ProFAR) isomerase
MDLFARVNILDGRAVRLPRGRISEAIALDADPLERAKGWRAKGVDRLLIVDLDAAAHGDYRNRPLVHDIIEQVDIPVQVAGGVRSAVEVERLLNAGAWRVAMGTAAILEQVMVWELCREHPGRIVVSLDVAENEELAIRGWTANSGTYLEEALIELSSAGAAGFMIAEVGRDALEEPPNLDALTLALSLVDEPVVAAGGVRDLDDLQTLLRLEVDGKRLGGVVVGREVTAGRFSIEDAVAVMGDATPTPVTWSSVELKAALERFIDSREDGAGPASAQAFVDWIEKQS